MTHPKKELTEKERKARALLTRPRLRFEPKSPERLAAEKAAKEKIKWDKAAGGTLPPGTTMPDGTLYAGVSPDTHSPLYTTPVDEPLTTTFGQAVKYAKSLNAHGHTDWRVPTEGELNVIFNNRAALGGFNKLHVWALEWYWSSRLQRPHADLALVQNFNAGNQVWYPVTYALSLRCVRG